jgi:hypothetical protein
VGSNSTGGIGAFLLWVLCVVRYRSLRGAGHSSRGVLLSVCVWVWSRNLNNEEPLAHEGCRSIKKNIYSCLGILYLTSHMFWQVQYGDGAISRHYILMV